LDETKAEPPIFTEASRRPKWDGGGGQGPGSPWGGAAQPLAVPPHYEARWPTFWRCPFAYKIPSTGKT
jgi:hypothetical protein